MTIATRNTTSEAVGDDISLKTIILRFREWIGYLFSKWLVICIAGIIGAGIGFGYAFWKKPLYSGRLSFIVEDSKTSPLSAYAGLASQIGLDLGGAAGSGIFAGDNILDFLRSRLMIEKSLLSTVKQGSKEVTLADIYIETNELNKGWSDKPQLKGLHFPANQNRKDFSLQQDSILNKIYEQILKTDLSVGKPDKKSGFIVVECITRNETFSMVFTKRLVTEAADFYTKVKTKRSKTNVDKLQSKADSIEYLLNKKTYSVAEQQDINLNPARRVATVSSELLGRDKLMLQTMYGEVVKNLEMTKIAMSQETPLIQVVDEPILPLNKIKVGKLKGLIVGGLLGAIVICFFLITARIYKLIMGSTEN
ncbi:MAG: lipopolysaccharide biosynthesis protein [Chitinophaga sp.]|uniref:lipopolysaccharide biosynthesis protein n=1 Tax=Chitinophaga sp. TaxID=1869181 RepID=UPI0025C0B394|nr:lipopolysaccharide biosynthesis protein [Chitinophaga sp.]MBV8254360.1 lipopolysaccharide biosynthesis protein [Chitinophaga sp.]